MPRSKVRHKASRKRRANQQKNQKSRREGQQRIAEIKHMIDVLDEAEQGYLAQQNEKENADDQK